MSDTDYSARRRAAAAQSTADDALRLASNNAQQLEKLLRGQREIMDMFNRLSAEVEKLKEEIHPKPMNKNSLTLPDQEP